MAAWTVPQFTTVQDYVQLRPTASIIEWILHYRHLCPGYHRIHWPHDSATDPVPPVGATSCTDIGFTRAARVHELMGTGIRFDYHEHLLDTTVSDLISACRPDVSLPSSVIEFINRERYRAFVSATQEHSIQANLVVEVFRIVNQLMDYRMMLFNDLEPVMPDGIWATLEDSQNSASPDGGFGIESLDAGTPGVYHFSVETKPPPFLLIDGNLDCLLRWGQGQASLSLPDFTHPPRGASEACKLIEQILEQVQTRKPRAVLLTCYTKLVFCVIRPPSLEQPYTKWVMSKVYDRYTTAIDGGLDPGNVSMAAMLLAISLRPENLPQRLWDHSYVWPSNTEIRGWPVGNEQPATSTGVYQTRSVSAANKASYESQRSLSAGAALSVDGLGLYGLCQREVDGALFHRVHPPNPSADPRPPTPVSPGAVVFSPDTCWDSGAVSASTPPSAAACSDPMTPAQEQFPLLCFGSYVSSGALGDVYRGSIDGRPVVVKVVIPDILRPAGRSSSDRLDSSQAREKLFHEAALYDGVLRPLQGDVVPVCHGLWAAERPGSEGRGAWIYALILDEIDASPNPEHSPEDVVALRRAYRMLDAAGVSHGDIRPRHWLKSSETGRWYIIDFDSAKLCAPSHADHSTLEHVVSLLS